MHNALINNWNSVVNDDDTVYILGDFTIGGSKEVNKYMPMLKGKKKYIAGNHCDFLRKKHYDGNLFELLVENENDIYDLVYKGNIFRLNHHKPLTVEPQIIYLHGHIHGFADYNIANRKNGLLVYDVGVDANNYTPVSIEQIIEFFKL